MQPNEKLGGSMNGITSPSMAHKASNQRGTNFVQGRTQMPTLYQTQSGESHPMYPVTVVNRDKLDEAKAKHYKAQFCMSPNPSQNCGFQTSYASHVGKEHTDPKNLAFDSFQNVHGKAYVKIGDRTKSTKYVSETTEVYTRPVTESHIMERVMIETKKDGDNMKKQMAKPSF